MKTLQNLMRLKERWEKAIVKDTDRRDRALKAIDAEISRRQKFPIRCALPKKKQRAIGLLPKLNSLF